MSDAFLAQSAIYARSVAVDVESEAEANDDFGFGFLGAVLCTRIQQRHLARNPHHGVSPPRAPACRSTSTSTFAYFQPEHAYVRPRWFARAWCLFTYISWTLRVPTSTYVPTSWALPPYVSRPRSIPIRTPPNSRPRSITLPQWLSESYDSASASIASSTTTHPTNIL